MTTKSDLCLKCGKCCQFFILEIRKPDLPSEVMAYEAWFAARGMIVVRAYANRWRLKFPWPCPHSKTLIINDVDLLSGERRHEENWLCDIYLERPDICRRFDGRLEDRRDGLDCLWIKEKPED